MLTPHELEIVSSQLCPNCKHHDKISTIVETGRRMGDSTKMLIVCPTSCKRIAEARKKLFDN